MSTIMGIPLFGVDSGPVRPLGKSLGYDEKFDRTLEFSKQAVDQGLLEVKSTYDMEATRKLTIGGVPLGGYPLNTRFVFWSYRAMANDQVFLKKAIEGDGHNIVGQLEASDSFSIAQAHGDGSINNIPALPVIEDSTYGETSQKVTVVARARLAAFIKYVGYCHTKQLVPLLSSSVYGGIAGQVLNNVSRVISEADENGDLLRRSRVMQLCHDEFMLDERLDALEMSDVIKLRTKAWGEQAAAREMLFESIFNISQSIKKSDEFETAARALIEKYRKESEQLQRERQNLNHSIKCDLGTGVLGAGTSAGLLSLLESPATIETTLAAGVMWALSKSKEHVPKWREIIHKERELKRGAGFGLHNFYSQIPRGN